MNPYPCDIHRITCYIGDLERFLSSIRQIATDNSVSIIFLDADNQAGIAHVESAIRHAYRAWIEQRQISNSLEMEVLLYAAGSRQCSVATRFGVHQGFNRAYLCICPPSHQVWDLLSPQVTQVAENWEEIPHEKAERLCTLFSITKEELAVVGKDCLPDLVLERVALLEVYR
jgi:KEOPS complex subunit Cgi121